ncbi:MAG: hypothetical protein ACXWX7_19345 [Candidatus Binatia bacterium]
MAAKNAKGAKEESGVVGAGLQPALLALAHRKIFAKYWVIRKNRREDRLPPRRKARQVWKGKKWDSYKRSSPPYYPTFASLAPLREIFRVSAAAVPRQVLRGEQHLCIYFRILVPTLET